MENGVEWEYSGGLCVCLCLIQPVSQVREMKCQILEIQFIASFVMVLLSKKEILFWFERSSNGSAAAPAAMAVVVVVVVVKVVMVVVVMMAVVVVAMVLVVAVVAIVLVLVLVVVLIVVVSVALAVVVVVAVAMASAVAEAATAAAGGVGGRGNISITSMELGTLLPNLTESPLYTEISTGSFILLIRELTLKN